MSKLNRRMFLGSAALVGGSCIATGCSTVALDPTQTDRTPQVRILPAQTTWAPAPAQVPATEGIATLPGGARLWYWDTGGSGEPVVLLHPGSSSGLCWEYQQPVLAKAGYRVIGYSRRGKYKSEPAAADDAGSGSGDLNELVDFLGLDRFHLVGTAAGGFVVLDYAVSHQERLLSLVFASSLGGIQDQEYGKVLKALLPPAFSQLPVDFQELGPSYRGGYRPGADRWLALHELSGSGMGQRQSSVNKVTWASIESLRVPTLLLTGDADLYMPPSSLREFARHLPGSEAAVVSEAGHSAYWEQPEAFNRELLRFLSKHRKR